MSGDVQYSTPKHFESAEVFLTLPHQLSFVKQPIAFCDTIKLKTFSN